MVMYEYRVDLKRIIDGDTFVAMFDLGFKIHREETVRLAGINTPESRTRNLEEKKHGLAAKKFLDATLRDAEKVVIQVEAMGKFGRALGVVYCDDVNVNKVLIAKGYAYPYGGERKLNYEEQLVEYPAMKEVYDELHQTKGS